MADLITGLVICTSLVILVVACLRINPRDDNVYDDDEDRESGLLEED